MAAARRGTMCAVASGSPIDARPASWWQGGTKSSRRPAHRTNLLSGLDELTASERRLAQMAAHDMSNKQIAQTPFVPVKTTATESLAKQDDRPLGSDGWV